MAFALKSNVSGISLNKSRVAVRRTAPVSRRAVVQVAAGKAFNPNWLDSNGIALPAAFVGWTVPSNIPVSAFGGKSLFGLLTTSIGEQLAHFPTGPALSDKFWLYLFTWHIGLFLAMFLGQIGVNGRKQGYW